MSENTKFYTLLKRGTSHTEFCEDFVYTTDISNDFFVGAVFDGCSGGDNSHFASSLFGKMLRNICEDLNETGVFCENNDLPKLILHKLFDSIKSASEILNLDTDDLLTTVLLIVYEYKTNSAKILISGDGFVSINGENTIIDQNNTPDYLAYSINNEFDRFYTEHIKQLQVDDVKDVTISTDGINTFLFSGNPEQKTNIDPINFLIQNNELKNLPIMLYRKHNLLKNKYFVSNSDDLACIRIIT